MSSAPYSPPDTPSKTVMAVDNENLTPKVRASDELLKPDPKQPALETPSKKIKQSQPNSEVQVPSTLPQHDQDDGAVNNAPQLEQTRSDPSGNLAEATEENREIETELTEPNSNAELSQMDWAGFQKRYRDAIQQAHDEETWLLEEFEKYFEVFRIWSLATSQRDCDRGWKRLRTRQRFVQLAEHKLEEKKAHYEQVVLAFKKALELLAR